MPEACGKGSLSHLTTGSRTEKTLAGNIGARITTSSSRAWRTAVRNLYLTSQDVAMLGVSGALFGGAVAASAVLGRNLVSTLTKPHRAGKAAA